MGELMLCHSHKHTKEFFFYICGGAGSIHPFSYHHCPTDTTCCCDLRSFIVVKRTDVPIFSEEGGHLPSALKYSAHKLNTT